MTIGEALKNERIKRGLSIRKMAGSIIDPSSYDKVEKGLRNIGSHALIKLIFTHNIDVDDFFNNLESTYAPQDFIYKRQLEQKIRSAFNHRDLKRLEKIKQEVATLKDEEILKLRVTVATAYLENKINQLNKETKQKIFDQLDKNDDLSNNIEAIRLFANAMPVFTDDQLNYLMHIYVLKIIQKKNLSELELKRFVVAGVNYLRACYERKIPLNEIMIQIQNYILNIDDISFLAYKGIVKLSLAAITGKIDLAKKIKNELIDIGYEEVKKWKF
ncbi:MAG: helix-turn-helix domain-containing protein [Lactobacillus sp.]